MAMKSMRDAPDAQGGFNDNHKRQILLTLGYVDKLLSDALRELSAAGQPSLFPRYVPDLSPRQQEALAVYLSRLREIMARVLDRHGISVPEPAISANKAFRSGLMCARINLTELKPRYMRGYGTLSSDAMRDLDVLTEELITVLDQMDKFLLQEAGNESREPDGDPHDGNIHGLL